MFKCWHSNHLTGVLQLVCFCLNCWTGKNFNMNIEVAFEYLFKELWKWNKTFKNYLFYYSPLYSAHFGYCSWGLRQESCFVYVEYFFYQFSLIVNRADRTEQENYFLICSWFLSENPHLLYSAFLLRLLWRVTLHDWISNRLVKTLLLT